MIHVRARAASETARVFLYLILFAAGLSPLTVPSFAQQPQPGSPDAAGDTVRLVVTVLDEKGRFVSGLGKQHFAVFEGKSPREISLFDDKDTPMSVLFLFDVSGSITDDQVAAAKLAAGRFIQLSHPETEYLIDEFTAGVRPLTGWTRDPAELIEAIKQVGNMRTHKKESSSQDTALFAARDFALDQVAQGHRAKRAVLIFSDGRDGGSRARPANTAPKAPDPDVLISCIGLKGRGYEDEMQMGTATVRGDFMGKLMLEAATAGSGGATFITGSAGDILGATERVAVELRHQYVIGFPAAEEAGAGKAKWREVKIRVTPPDKKLKGVTARSSGGYLYPRPKS